MKLTFGQVFAFSLVGLIALLALLFQLVSAGSRETIAESSERIREQATTAIGERIASFLDEAPEAARQFQREVEHGLVNAREPQAIEATLCTLLLANHELGEVTFTYGEAAGFNDDGDVKLEAMPRGQWSAMRGTGTDGKPRFLSRHLYQDGAGFVADRRELSPQARFGSAPWARETSNHIPDPTAHLTFTTPASRDFRGRLVWSDLHWSQLDAELPKEKKRVEVTVQQSMTDAEGRFIGVLRVGLLIEELDDKVRQRLSAAGAKDPHRTFLCDEDGRLITRIAPTDRLEEVGDDLRIAPGSLPPEITAALASSIRMAAVDRKTSVSGEFRAGGKDYLATFRAMPRRQTQGWIIGIVVPREYYFGRAAKMRERLLGTLLGVMVLLVAAGAVILLGVRRAQAQITRESLKMNAFDFTPAHPDSPFRDVTDVLESQEKAKTAMRAMSKYVPIDLVRRLYREKSEPVLGGELMEVSIMFTDIKDFTTVSEKLAPNDLADALGWYLGAMAGIIQRESRGTIDKFIGDAIMTFWNAPEPVADHPRMACLAALRCREAGTALARLPEWGDRPAFETRFGLHCGPALIGHFGAPDRMNYTAMGDAVNLASRLEGLNKQYGTTIIASEAIVGRTGGDFVFRLLDLVAVKGKSEAVRIYELLGRAGEAAEMAETVAAYEKAFAAYSGKDFAGAIQILERQAGDLPSIRLLERCRAYLEEPPAEEWCGVYVATMK